MDGRIVMHPDPTTQPVAGGTSIFNLQEGQSYREFLPRITGAGTALTIAQLKADVELVTVKVNGRTKWELSGTELLDLTWSYYGHALGFPFADIGSIPIFFVPFHYANQELAEGLALGMLGLESAQILIKWAAGMATADLVSARAKVGPNHYPGKIRCIRRNIRARASTGWEGRTELNPQAADRLVCIHTTLGATPGVISEMDFKINGDPYFAYRTHDLDLALAKGRRTKIASWNHMDFALRSLAQDAIAFGGPTADEAAKNVKVVSCERRINWTTLPAAYVEIDERIEDAISAQ